MIRITGGRRKGTLLTAPRGTQTRPATGRVRQWIFDVLGPPHDLSVLDLFAGTGAVGLEALSRGAASSLFVESWKPALDALRKNVDRTGFEDRAEIWTTDVSRACERLKGDGRSFDLCFCDPPYGYQRLETLLADRVLDLVSDGGTLVVEHRGEEPLRPADSLPDREESFGGTVVSIWTIERTKRG